MVLWNVPRSQDYDFLKCFLHAIASLSDASKFYIIQYLQYAPLPKIQKYNIWVSFSVWNFKRHFWNSTQNNFIHTLQGRISWNAEIVRHPKFQSLYTLLKSLHAINITTNESSKCKNCCDRNFVADIEAKCRFHSSSISLRLSTAYAIRYDIFRPTKSGRHFTNDIFSLDFLQEVRFEWNFLLSGPIII